MSWMTTAGDSVPPQKVCPATWILLWPHADWSLQLNLNKISISIQEHLVIFGHSVYANI